MKRAITGAALLLSACSGATTKEATPIATATSSGAPVAGAPYEECAAFTSASLAPKLLPKETKTFTLGELFPAEQARPKGAKTMTFEMGDLQLGARQSGKTGVASLVESPPFGRKWIAGGVRTELVAPLEQWVAAFEARGDASTLGDLLDARLRVIDATKPADLEHQRFCVRSAIEKNKKSLTAARSSVDAAQAELAKLVAELEAPSASERFIQADLLARNKDTRDAGRTKLEAIVKDTAAPKEIRGRAEQRLAGITSDHDLHCRNAGKLIPLPDFELTTCNTVYGEAGSDRAKELEALAAQTEASTDPRAPALLPHLLASLGDAQAARGRDDAALATFAKCLRVAPVTVDWPEDDAGCAWRLGELIGRAPGVRGAAMKLEVPVTFAGFLGFEAMRVAVDVYDRDEALRAGTLALTLDPSSPWSMWIATLLAEHAPEADREKRFEERDKAFGPDTPWRKELERRLVTRSAEELGLQLQGILVPTIAWPEEPKTPEAWREEIGARLEPLRSPCTAVVEKTAAGGTELTIDTTGAIPSVKLGGRPRSELQTCFEEVVRHHFRSVPPATIKLRIL